MRRPLPWSMLVLILLTLLVPATAGAAPADRVSSCALKPADDHCMFVIAGKDATTDGSVLMGYNNDWSANNYVYLQTIPATATSNGYTRILTWGGVPEGGINEHQLAACFGSATTLAEEVIDADGFVGNGYGGEVWDLILTNCSSAREAIDYLERCALTKGFSSGAAGSFGIADPDEAWVFELLGGHHWVAARVPDDCYYAQPNMLRIRQIDLGDPDNFRGSDDLQSFAESIGRYDPAEGPFDVAWAYGDRDDLQTYYDTNRLWGVTFRWSPLLALDVAMPYATRPVFARPDHLLSREDVMAFTREHYEGTQLDQTDGYTLMSPHDQTNRPICDATTDYGSVFQCRGWLPDAVGGVLWLAPSRPCSSVYVPFYCCSTSIATTWTDRTAYDAFRAVADSLDAKVPGNREVRYRTYIGLVQDAYGTFYTATLAEQSRVEELAVSRSSKKKKVSAIARLTQFSCARAEAAYDLAMELPADMP